MKTWYFALPVLCSACLVQAADPAGPAAAQAASQARQQMTAQERARQHQRDMRYCLDNKSNKAIHRCAVKRNKR